MYKTYIAKYKTAYLLILSLNILSFGFIITNIIFTGDSYSYGYNSMPNRIIFPVSSGRLQAIIVNLFAGGQQIPYLLLSLAILLNTLTAIIISRLFRAKGLLQYVVIGAIFSICPFWSELFGISFTVLGVSFSFLFVVISLYLLKTRITIKTVFLSLVLCTLAGSLYQGIVQYGATFIAAQILLELLHSKKYLTTIKKWFLIGIIFILSFILYLCLIKIAYHLLHYQLTYDGGIAIKTPIVEQFIEKALIYYVSVTFYTSTTAKITFGLLYLLSFVVILKNYRKINNISILILLMLLLIVIPVLPLSLKLIKDIVYWNGTLFGYSVVYILGYKLILMSLKNTKIRLYIVNFFVVCSIFMYVKSNNLIQLYAYKDNVETKFLITNIINRLSLLNLDNKYNIYYVNLITKSNRAFFTCRRKLKDMDIIKFHDLFKNNPNLCKQTIMNYQLRSVSSNEALKYYLSSYGILNTPFGSGVTKKQDTYKYWQKIKGIFPAKDSILIEKDKIYVKIQQPHRKEYHKRS